jgi:rhodanese-related sulfurtransferase
LESRGSLEQVDRVELLRRVRSGEVTVLDVRPTEEYQAGRLPHALSIPLAELEKRMAELPKNQEIVAYCRGPYCVLAVEAVRQLRQRGFRAVRLDWGVVDWQSRGFRLEVGNGLSSSR